ncbi:hypothetical protein [Prevotella sp. KH2C16]|uniref:hypothetical protein n=1 Tax=Prevotella sp. KH2C16 TaxID=1855325 RepID=UPI0008F25F35|nr:hypothetical protein [Prevotella sp. KH2C16]SFF84647.1 hypothetical protein SAMN05216383_101182 [Prevotella sp. KH2C16]
MDIQTLIDRFYDGKATEEEELRLMDFFAGNDVPAKLQEEKDFFRQYFRLDEAMPDDLELESRIDEWNTVEKSFGRKAMSKSLRWAVGIAASLLLILSLGVFLNQQEDASSFALQEDTYTNPEDAYKETRKVLMLFSENLNKGLNALNHKEKK